MDKRPAVTFANTSINFSLDFYCYIHIGISDEGEKKVKNKKKIKSKKKKSIAKILQLAVLLFVNVFVICYMICVFAFFNCQKYKCIDTIITCENIT